MEMNRAFENITFYNKVKSVYAKQNNKSIKECWQYNKTVEFITNSKWCFMISTKLYLPRTFASRRASNNRPIGQMIQTWNKITISSERTKRSQNLVWNHLNKHRLTNFSGMHVEKMYYEGVRRWLIKLKKNKFTGADGITDEFLKPLRYIGKRFLYRKPTCLSHTSHREHIPKEKSISSSFLRSLPCF